ncbi:hypothetical protein J2857_006011 [Neorhizobium galegae]|uniref:hypothetical protein n=1 Tax=Neorhizobium galegae TaxID=399 RepID=UPI001AEA3B2D|nr:hypothetical protein [Neorhizobium galegae]MBP2563212.1 hypothetical protein [Neorhizobium galegae]
MKFILQIAAAVAPESICLQFEHDLLFKPKSVKNCAWGLDRWRKTGIKIKTHTKGCVMRDEKKLSK